MSQLAYLKVKVCSLAAEAKIIRREETRWWMRDRDDSNTPCATFFGLRTHRIEVVRREARSALLAYGFIRGSAYAAMEAKSHEDPNWFRVAELVIRYGNPSQHNLPKKPAELSPFLRQWAKGELTLQFEKSEQKAA